MKKLRDLVPGVGLFEICMGVAAIALVFFVAWFMITEPGRERDRAAKERAAAMSAQGSVLAGKDAIGIITAGAARDAVTDDITRTNADAISKAPGASAPVDPALARAGRRGLCEREAYRSTAACLR